MFVAYVVQKGQGCDYTIACGETVWELEVQTWEEARDDLKRRVLGELHSEYGYQEGYRGESELGAVTLYEVSGVVKIDLDEWYSEARSVEARIAAMEGERKRRVEYERLRREFGGEEVR